MWNFSDLRAYLLPLAEHLLDDVDKIIFSRQFDIQDWLVPAHVNLCQRAKPLTTEEATKIGIHSLLIISHLREQLRHPAPVPISGSTQYYCINCIGVAYSGSNVNCDACGCRGYGVFYRDDSLTLNEKAKATLEIQVKKWVEGGCVLK